MHKAELASASLSPAGVVSFKPNGTRSDTLDYTAVGIVRIVRNSLQVFAYSAITKRLRDFLGVVAKNRHWLLVLLQIDIAKRSILEVKGFHMIFHMIPLGIDCISSSVILRAWQGWTARSPGHKTRCAMSKSVRALTQSTMDPINVTLIMPEAARGLGL